MNNFEEYLIKEIDPRTGEVSILRKLQKINELYNIMNETTKINTQAAGDTAIRNQYFIVGSIDAKGDLSFSPNPTIHFGSTSARNECARLAVMHPGKTFLFVKLMGGERAVPQPRTISI